MSSKQERETDRGSAVEASEAGPLQDLSPRAREVVAIALCGFGVYALLCLATFRMADLDGVIPAGGMQNLGGAVGYYLALGFTRSLGFAGWVPFVMLLVYTLMIFRGRSCSRITIKMLGIVCFSATLAILLAGHDGLSGVRSSTPFGAGGVFGSVVSPKLYAAFGGTGRVLILLFGALVSLLIATEWMFSELMLRTYEALAPSARRLFGRPLVAGVGDVDELDAREVASPTRRRGSASAEAFEDEEEAEGEEAEEEEREDEGDEDENEDDEEYEYEEYEDDEEEECEEDEEEAAADDDGEVVEGTGEVATEQPQPEPMVIVRPKPRKRRKKPATQTALPFADYPYPPIELFQEPQTNDLCATSEALERGGRAIISKLANFNVQAEVVAAAVGPAVTQYELRLAESIRVNKVVGFADDLAAALKAISVRVVAPIPGKDTIGVEVPNEDREKVYMRDLLELYGRAEELAIPLYLGKDVAGNPIVEDLARMPHLLIAGTTGSGKSVCINTILLSILMTRTPQEVKLILVDPKMVELQAYKKVPHLCCEVVTNTKKAPGVLQWAVDE
ncbi:MAG: DNA translocase FtsK 4TM domain-containing protein, partial [Planctomycetota bacterium]|nr:DNA translocase FtsK 4TM domain-containing protein [Planctomycetota bacterium]